jgi:hypothetical protein
MTYNSAADAKLAKIMAPITTSLPTILMVRQLRSQVYSCGNGDVNEDERPRLLAGHYL